MVPHRPPPLPPVNYRARRGWGTMLVPWVLGDYSAPTTDDAYPLHLGGGTASDLQRGGTNMEQPPRPRLEAFGVNIRHICPSPIHGAAGGGISGNCRGPTAP